MNLISYDGTINNQLTKYNALNWNNDEQNKTKRLFGNKTHLFGYKTTTLMSQTR